MIYLWANLAGDIVGFFGTVMLGISAELIPWGLHLPKEKRFPFKKPGVSGGVTNSCGQTTASQEWWGLFLKRLGWVSLGVSFLILIFADLPQRFL